MIPENYVDVIAMELRRAGKIPPIRQEATK